MRWREKQPKWKFVELSLHQLQLRTDMLLHLRFHNRAGTVLKFLERRWLFRAELEEIQGMVEGGK